jgi:hypothetical protein
MLRKPVSAHGEFDLKDPCWALPYRSFETEALNSNLYLVAWVGGSEWRSRPLGIPAVFR